MQIISSCSTSPSFATRTKTLSIPIHTRAHTQKHKNIRAGLKSKPSPIFPNSKMQLYMRSLDDKCHCRTCLLLPLFLLFFAYVQIRCVMSPRRENLSCLHLTPKRHSEKEEVGKRYRQASHNHNNGADPHGQAVQKVLAHVDICQELDQKHSQIVLSHCEMLVQIDDPASVPENGRPGSPEPEDHTRMGVVSCKWMPAGLSPVQGGNRAVGLFYVFLLINIESTTEVKIRDAPRYASRSRYYK